MSQRAMAWNGDSLHHDGKEILRYGDNGRVAYWAHSGIRISDEPMWCMSEDVAERLPERLKTLYVAYEATDGENVPVYRVDVDALCDDETWFDGIRQHGARSTDDYVRYVGLAADVLPYNLAPCGREQGAYHKRRSES